MIAKEVDYQAALDYIDARLSEGDLPKKEFWELKNRRAGLAAESDVAYKLRSFFADLPDTYVINNLKLAVNGTTIQIDHLVLGRSNYYVIESKSVAGNLSVNEFGEWFRWFNNQSSPMDSPVIQAERQLDLLKKYMQENNEVFQGKFLGLQKQMGTYTGHHYVAVSNGAISGKGRADFPNVMRADQVISTVKEHVKKHNKHFLVGLFSTKDEDFKLLSRDELEKLVEFLLSENLAVEPVEELKGMHTSESPKSVELTEIQPVSSIPVEDAQQPVVTETRGESKTELVGLVCGQCTSSQVLVKYGHSYYINCQNCRKNTPIRGLVCDSCGSEARVRKSQQEFFSKCTSCESEKLIHKNPV